MKINPAYVAAALAVACVIDAAPIPAANPADIVIQRSTDESNHLDELTRRWTPSFDWVPDLRTLKYYTWGNFQAWRAPTYMRGGTSVFVPVKQKSLWPSWLGGKGTTHVKMMPHDDHPQTRVRPLFEGKMISRDRPAVKELTNDTE